MELRLEVDLKLDKSGNSFPCGTLILMNNKAVKLIEHSNTNFIIQEFSKEAFPIKPNNYEVEYLHKYNLISEVHNATIQIKDGFKFYTKLSQNEKFKIKWMVLVDWSKQPENTWKVFIFITATILAIIGLI
ncbi:hypothetical protein AB3G34_09420 [Flavobacterium sp. WC2409]|uniref:Uncharacterized protein n=1 Tax=Flavobacterium sp. WC2409 TaxID=3234139 RepID=A0AB39VZ36_9FLAO